MSSGSPCSLVTDSTSADEEETYPVSNDNNTMSYGFLAHIELILLLLLERHLKGLLEMLYCYLVLRVNLKLILFLLVKQRPFQALLEMI